MTKESPIIRGMQETVFRAIGHPVRRKILDRLFAEDGQTLGRIEELFSMTRFGVMKHLKLLEEAGLVTSRKVGRERFHYLNPIPIREVHDRWIGKFAEEAASKLLGLKSSLENGGSMQNEAKPSHVFSIFIKTSPEHLWEAITSSEFTTKYYYSSAVESDWKVGAALVYRIGEDTAILGEVLEADSPRRLVCTFDARWDEEVASDPPTRIVWEIEEVGDDVCKLTVVHDGFDTETATFHSIGGGMPYILSGLKTLIETGEPLRSAVA